MGSPVVAAIERRLSEGGYDVARDVEMSLRLGSKAEPGGRVLKLKPDVVASKFYFAWRAIGYISQNIFVSELPAGGVPDLDALYAAGLHYSFAHKSPASYLTRAERMWSNLAFAPANLPFIKSQGGYVTIPVLVTPKPSKELIAYAETKPRQSLRQFHLPVVVDAGTGAAHYCRRTGIFGAALFVEMRKIIAKFIEAKAG